MSWGIAETASEIEKIKSDSDDYLNGLNSCGVIDWDTYNYAFDFYTDLLMEAYRQGHKDAQPERKKGKWICWYEEIKNDTCTEYIPHCKCSECGTEYDPHTVKFINFCSYCGAEMRGEECTKAQ